ncbi:S41 family peptidase [bacterium]|nr:S41 family peptidase [bacterium]
MKTWKTIVVACVIGILLIGTAFYGGFRFALVQYDLAELPATRFALSTVRNYFIRPVEDSMIAKGILSATQDPYSVFFTKEEFEAFEIQLAESYVGIGIMITQSEEGFEITKVFPDSPANDAKIRSGMMIREVNAESVKGHDLDWVASKVRGPENTSVKITVYTPDTKQENEIELIRKKVKLQTVASKMLDNDVAYIAIHSFSHGTAQDFAIQLDQLLAGKPKAMILDLRDNTGGLLDETISIAQRILPSHSVLFYTKGRDNQLGEQTIGESIPINIPLYVIVNQNSASASEVLAGAIQDLKVGKLVGEKTYGKASIQKVFPNMLTGDCIKLTVQTYLTPNKQDIMEKGITPDILYEKLEWSKPFGQDPVVLFVLEKIQ